MAPTSTHVMQCLILAGGLGTRMQGVAADIEGIGNTAKTLIPVLGRPFADHQLTWLAGQGVDRVVYAIGHLGGQIRDFVGDGRRWGLDIAYVDEGENLMGTGAAVRKAVEEAGLDGGFLVLYGDSYLRIDVPALWAASGQGARPVMSVLRNQGRWDASNAVYADGMVTLFEKGRVDAAAIGMDFIDYGISVLNGDIVRDHVPAGASYDLAGVYQRLAEAGTLHGYEATERFYEIGSPEGLVDLEAHLAGLSSA